MIRHIVFIGLMLITATAHAERVVVDWTDTIGTGTPTPLAVYVDSLSFVYVIGFSDDGGTGDVAVVRKYNDSGGAVWEEVIDLPMDDDNFWATAFQPDGTIYMTGYASDAAGPVLSVALTLALTPNGNVDWYDYAPPLDNGIQATLRTMTLDNGGNVIVGGKTRISTNTNESGANNLLIKYNSSGSRLWSRQYTSPGYGTDEIQQVATDSSGNIYATARLRSDEWNPLDDHVGMFKYSPGGALLWERIIPPQDRYVYPTALDVTVDGDVYLAVGGPTENRLIRWDTDGNSLWSLDHTAAVNFHATDVSVDADKNCYVTGYGNLGVTRVDSLGNIAWTYEFAPNSFGARGYSLHLDSAGDPIVVGVVQQAAYQSPFVGKLTADGTAIWEAVYDAPTQPSGIFEQHLLAFDGDSGFYQIQREISRLRVIHYLEKPLGINPITDQYIEETDTLRFDVISRNGSLPPAALSYSELPAGAQFVDYQDGTGEFVWAPDSTQSDTFHVTFTATDTTINMRARPAVDQAVEELQIIVGDSRRFIVKDARDSLLRNISFLLYEVQDNPPVYSRAIRGTVTTDDEGEFNVPESLPEGALILLEKKLHEEPALKHPGVQDVMYTVYLDNMKFDTLGRVALDTVTNNLKKTLRMDHTTLVFDLVISIEWDASLDYLQRTEQAFRNMSNYLYDVSDGQMRFGEIGIYDDREQWHQADAVIYASNIIWPHVDSVGGLYRATGPHADPIEMPRKWFGSRDDSRNGSATEVPLVIDAPNDYRTRVHEFGHYGLKFYDEYVFLGFGNRCGAVSNYGFMDDHYDVFSPYSSEMSYLLTYSPDACRNTKQYGRHQMSCWEMLETDFEKRYTDDSLLASIFTPLERDLPTNSDVFPGPNGLLNQLNYDVGALMRFPVPPTPPSVQEFKAYGSPDIAVSVERTDGSLLLQGKTSDLGEILIVGAETNSIISANGSVAAAPPSARATAAAGHTWVYGSVTATGTDVTIPMHEVQGSYPTINHMTLSGDSIFVDIDFLQAFPAPPGARLLFYEWNEYDDFTMGADTISYAGLYTQAITDFGALQIRPTDDTGAVFFYTNPYERHRYIPKTPELSLHAADGAVALDLWNPDSISQALILASPYPVIRTGLDPASNPVTDAISVSTNPSTAADSGSYITLRYSLGNPANGHRSEATVRIFSWNGASRNWQALESRVDTAQDLVVARYNGDGVYAAFTTDAPTDIDDRGGPVRPDSYRLGQNFPNPFNPSTTIEFDLPHSAAVRVDVFNVLGQHVITLVDARRPAGHHRVAWDGRTRAGQRVASGVYFYRLTTDDYSRVRKMLLLK